MGLSLVELKEGFSTLLKQADPEVLPRFVAWMDLKISEYKVNTCIMLDPAYDNSSVWLQFVCGENDPSVNSNNKNTSSDTPSDYRTLKDILQNEFTDYTGQRRGHLPTATAPADLPCSNAGNGYELVNGVMKVGRYSFADGSFTAEDGSVTETGEKFDMGSCNDSENMADTVNSSEGSVFGDTTKNTLDDIDNTGEYRGKTVTINGQKYFACKKCGKMFTHSSSLHRHIKLHKGIFSHMCTVCGRKFARKEHYNNHKCHRRPNIPSRGMLGEDACGDAVETSLEEKDWESAGIYAPLHQSTPQKQDQDLLSSSDKVTMPEPMATQPVFPEFQMLSSQIKVENTGTEEETAVQENNPAEHDQNGVAGGMPDPDVLDSSASGTVFQNSMEHTTGSGSVYCDQDSSPSHLVVKEVVSLNSQVERETLSNHIMQTTNHNSLHVDNGPNDLILLDTGKYKVETEGQKDNTFIRVTKQGKYLNLKNELQMVDGQWCFVCPHCGKRFERSSNFSRHMKLHRGVYSYICPNCKRGFFRKEHFTKHICGRRAMSHTWDRNTKLGKLGDPQQESDETVSILAPTTSPKAKVGQHPMSFRSTNSNYGNMEVDGNPPTKTGKQLQVGASRRKPQRSAVTRVETNLADSDSSQQDYLVDSILPEESFVLE